MVFKLKKLIIRNIIKINYYSRKEKYLYIQKMLYIRGFLNINATPYEPSYLFLQV